MVRWWNIALVALVLILIASVVAAFAYPGITKDMYGNVLAEIWGIAGSALVAYVLFRRFRDEQFERTVYDIFGPLEKMRAIVLDIYEPTSGTPTLAVVAQEQRRRLEDLAQLAYARGALYSRFLELDEMEHIDRAATAAREIARMSAVDTAASMCTLLHNVFMVNAYASTEPSVYQLDLSRRIQADEKRWRDEVAQSRQRSAT